MTFYRWTIYLLGFTVLLSNISCNPKQKQQQKPNILWIFLEDTAPLMGCYGTTLISTPNIDKLADSGTLYTNAIMPAPVCSPSRSSIITGVMSTTTGTHNHHSARTPESSIYLPEGMSTIPELFKKAGYFTFNNGKDDYNFTYDREDLYTQDYKHHPLYGKSGERLDLANLADKVPFFGQVQLYGGKEIFSSKFDERVPTPVDRSSIILPPYLPDHPTIIEEYADHLDAIQITDTRVGDILSKLEEGGVLNNTIIFFFSDHGMRLTRNKQFLYEGGINVPLIIADFRTSQKITTGHTEDELVSGIDLGPASLALAGIPIPDYVEGVDFIHDPKEREYVISTRDRCDFTIDRIRSVRTERFKYIKNFMPDRPYTQTTYMDVDKVAFVDTMSHLAKNGHLNKIQGHFFQDSKPIEELYDLDVDPFELTNLATDPQYADVLQEHANILTHWIRASGDKGRYPEDEENLKLMLGIWGDHATAPEYDALRAKHPNLSSSQFGLKSEKWKKVQLDRDK